jgi:hypothetical protein
MYSPDGRWWWNGAEWTPAPTWRTRYVVTPWTRPMQIAVLALQAIGLLLAAVTLPTIYASMINNNPALAGDPQTAEFFRQFFAATMVFVLAWSLIVVAVFVVGVLKLWRWLFWYLAVSYGFAALAIPVNLSYALGSAPIRYPTWFLFVALPINLVEVAIAVWMLVAYRRYGTWARRKIVEPA